MLLPIVCQFPVRHWTIPVCRYIPARGFYSHGSGSDGQVFSEEFYDLLRSARENRLHVEPASRVADLSKPASMPERGAIVAPVRYPPPNRPLQSESICSSALFAQSDAADAGAPRGTAAMVGTPHNSRRRAARPSFRTCLPALPAREHPHAVNRESLPSHGPMAFCGMPVRNRSRWRRARLFPILHTVT